MTSAQYIDLPDPFEGYLKDLRQHHGSMPVLVSEFGLSTAVAAAHFEYKTGRNHGHVTEAEQGKHLVEMFASSVRQKFCGAMLFSLTDEWFKRTWNVMDTELPVLSRARWLNVLSAEQMFGIVAAEPKEMLTMDGKCNDWNKPADSRFPVVSSAGGKLSVTNDEAFVYVRVSGYDTAQKLFIALNSVPGGSALTAVHPALTAASDAYLEVDFAKNSATYRVHPVIDYFHHRYGPEFDMIVPLDGSTFNLFKVAVSFPYVEVVSRVSHPSQADIVGNFDRGTTNLDLWNYGDSSCFEVRIPWTMTGSSDPSTRTAFSVQGSGKGTAVSTLSMESGIEIQVAQGTDTLNEKLQYVWPTWTDPLFVERRKDSFAAVKAWANSGTPHSGAPPPPDAAATPDTTSAATAARVSVTAMIVLFSVALSVLFAHFL
jgi:hypothetical protein